MIKRIAQVVSAGVFAATMFGTEADADHHRRPPPPSGGDTSATALSAAAAAAQAEANNHNLVVVSPRTTAHGGRGGHGGDGGNVGDVTTEVVNTNEFNDRLQAGVAPSIVVAPTSQCGEGFGFAAGFVGGSVGTSFSSINFRCVDTGAALTLFQSGDADERAVALRTLANLSPAFDSALESVASTLERCMEGTDHRPVFTATDRCTPRGD